MIYIWLVVLSIAFIITAFQVINLLDLLTKMADIVEELQTIITTRNETVNKLLDDTIEILNRLNNKETRRCSDCGKIMTSGFCIDDGAEYYCSEECLYKHYTTEEWIDLYDNNRGYYTEWEKEEEIEII